MKRPSKYLNRKVEIDGLAFDSAKEASRWVDLNLWQRNGGISNLRRQVRFPLEVNGTKVASVVADFAYDLQGREVVEDTKSDFTRKLPVWRLKSKMFAAQYGFPIREV